MHTTSTWTGDSQAGVFAVHGVGFTLGDPEPFPQEHQNVVHESFTWDSHNTRAGGKSNWHVVLCCVGVTGVICNHLHMVFQNIVNNCCSQTGICGPHSVKTNNTLDGRVCMYTLLLNGQIFTKIT